MNLKLLYYSSATSSALSHATINQCNVLLALHNVTCVYYCEEDTSAATETLIKLTNVYYHTIKQYNLPQNNSKDTVIILIRALSFLGDA